MPAGLDGHPDPVRSPARDRVLATVAAHVATGGRERTIVAVDGRSGVGKSTFADELAAAIQRSGAGTIRSTTDSFHRPRAERMRRGAASPEGYYLDSHQLAVIVDELLRPFSEGASQVRVAAFDEPTDTAVDERVEVGDRSVLIFDGLFAHRPELRLWWNHSVLLTADERLDADWLTYLLDDLPELPSARASAIDDRLQRARWPRYRRGWQYYLVEAQPQDQACIVIDNNQLTAPTIVTR